MTEIPVLTAFGMRWRGVPHRFGGLGACAPLAGALPEPLPLCGVSAVAGPPPGVEDVVGEVVDEWERALRGSSGGFVSAVAAGNQPGQSEVHGSNRGLRAGGGLDVRVLPSVRLFGVGYRRSGPGRADAVTAAPLEHRVRLPRACLAGLTDAGLGRSVVLLRGFHVAGIAFKQAGASSSDHPLGRWIRQGTHLRRLCMGGRVGAVQPDHVELELTAGLIGGHADDADPAQLWTGFDGYAMSLQLVLVSSEQEPVEDAVRVALSSRARSGVRVFQQPMTTAEVGGLTSVDVCVRALQAGRVEGDEGRLVHDLAVRWEAPDRVWAEFSNAGLGAGAFEGEVFVRRARLRAAQDREVLT